MSAESADQLFERTHPRDRRSYFSAEFSQRLVKHRKRLRLCVLRPVLIRPQPDSTSATLCCLISCAAFKDLGHEVIFLIGDFTGRIGDPNCKNITRQPLSREQVLENAQTYEAQIYKVLDPVRTRVEFNSRWLDKLTATELIQLAAKHTVARMLAAGRFHQTLGQGQPIAIHEFLYPLIQGYDSVVLKAEIQLWRH